MPRRVNSSDSFTNISYKSTEPTLSLRDVNESMIAIHGRDNTVPPTLSLQLEI